MRHAMPPPPRPRSRRRTIAGEPPPGLFPARGDLLRLLAVLSIAAATVTVCSLLNRRPQPFCDSHATDYGDSCESCPQNGRCVDGELQCIQGFKKYGRTCVEDGLLSQTATKISELLQRRICVQHARALCGKPAKILFQMHDISNMVDELLSQNSAALTEDGIKLVKVRVLQTVRGLLDTALTFDRGEAFKCPELVAEFHVPLACRIRQWIVRNIIFVTTFCFLQCSGCCGAFTINGHYQIEQSKYTTRCVKSLKIMPQMARLAAPTVILGWLRLG